MRSELNSILESARHPNWNAFERVTVSPDLTVFVDRCGETLRLEESEAMVNAMRLASWKRRYASTDSSDLPRNAVVRAEAVIPSSVATLTRVRARG